MTISSLGLPLNFIDNWQILFLLNTPDWTEWKLNILHLILVCTQIRMHYKDFTMVSCKFIIGNQIIRHFPRSDWRRKVDPFSFSAWKIRRCFIGFELQLQLRLLYSQCNGFNQKWSNIIIIDWQSAEDEWKEANQKKKNNGKFIGKPLQMRPTLIVPSKISMHLSHPMRRECI